MRAFVTELQAFLKLDTRNDGANFKRNIQKLIIPLYQREYKWEDEKISSLIIDIFRRDKFLGNIILDEKANYYEIVDGQQRITTCFLILVYLYNFYIGSPFEQEDILSILKPYGEFVLHNDSIGNYITENNNSISLMVNPDTDVYSQADDFNRAYSTLSNKLSSIITSTEVARTFKQKLLSSKLLVLINDQNNTLPIEQVFLDINEKAQLLDSEDIFKGHCFEIFTPTRHPQLRQTWINLKKCATGFKQFGLKNLGEYLYLYLLEFDRTELPQKMNPGGRHYLEGKTMDEVNTLLSSMIAYGQSIVKYSGNIKNTEYRFCDVCEDSQRYQYTQDHLAMKDMSAAILFQEKSYYQKIPFMCLISWLLNDNTPLRTQLQHDGLKRILTNLYVYASLFAISSAKKSKSLIDQTIRDALRSNEDQVLQLLTAAKELRRSEVSKYTPNPGAKYEELVHVYSITDNYISLSNWIRLLYTRENGYNLEHFIIPDISSRKIKWQHSPSPIMIEIDKQFAKDYKKKACNYLIINSTLNESMENFDIVQKVAMIKEWHAARSMSLPRHIQVFISHIESMSEYQQLLLLSTSEANETQVKEAYKAFLIRYFSDENQGLLLSSLKAAFINAFHN